jgi:hypothetical protein
MVAFLLAAAVKMDAAADFSLNIGGGDLYFARADTWARP